MGQSTLVAARSYQANSAPVSVTRFPGDALLNGGAEALREFPLTPEPPAAIELPSTNDLPEDPVAGQGTTLSGIRQYVHEQLLSAPGGDAYDLDAADPMHAAAAHQASYGTSLAKDFRDAAANLKKAGADLTVGSTYRYEAADGSIQTGRRRGFFGALASAAKNLASAVTFGAYTPAGETPPQGFFGRLKHFAKKLFVDAISKDLVTGTASTVINAGEHLALAALNTVEVIPDATIGATRGGRAATTAVFDSAQVGISAIADVLPSGDGYLRVFATGSKEQGFGLPVVSNLQGPKNGSQDARWNHVHNSGFRKTIETVGSLASAAGAFVFGLPTLLFRGRGHQEQSVPMAIQVAENSQANVRRR